MWLLRTFTATISLFLIVFTIPLSFDVGGRECGLAFSLSLASFYLFYSTIRLVTPPGSRFRAAFTWLTGSTQWLTIVTLLIWSLNKFSVDSSSSGWVERTFGGKRAADASVREWLFGRGGLLESFVMGGWDKTLRWLTPVFQILEGFCSLLVIQACGQVGKRLVTRDGGDSWAIGLLGLSAGVFSSALYFLWKISTFPELSNVDAILIGSAITCAIFLATWGITSGRGNAVESALLFAYITLCVYQIFNDYQPTHPYGSSSAHAPVDDHQPALPPLPPIIMASYSTLMHALSTLPSTMHSAFNFLVAAVMTITPSVIISLVYRVFVMYASARIIPTVRESGARALSDSPSLDDSNEAGRILAFIGNFSPSILVAVYTSLLMQYFSAGSANGANGGELDWWTNQGGTSGGNLSRWINLALTMIVYCIELYLGLEESEMGLTSSWKAD